MSLFSNVNSIIPQQPYEYSQQEVQENNIEYIDENVRPISITQSDFINILIKYKIPVAQQTVDEIRKHNIYIL